MENKIQSFDESLQDQNDSVHDLLTPDSLNLVQFHLAPSQNLSTSDWVNLSMISNKHRTLFKPLVDVYQLLHYAVRSQYSEVKKLLKKDINLMLKRERVVDLSGREFQSISGFEYALWALDKHMWTMMLECMPKDEEGKKVLAELLFQYDKVCTEGVTYSLDGKTITENHFDFQGTIIKELQIQYDSLHSPQLDWDAINQQWIKGVGGAQRKLPMHVVYEYCSTDFLFNPPPKFTFRPQSSMKLYNHRTSKYEDWFSIDSKLGIDFTAHKGENHYGAIAAFGAVDGHTELDAMKALYEIRINEFFEFKSQATAYLEYDNQLVAPLI
ncbi:F-box protein [Legionella sainthelensi]|uniref:F-box protein n=1 Tax=Legionella sainthelensi TaxID=28087 RepID=UPI002165145F|nr:F-box protein [Legionella sainthelensi]